MCAKQTRSARRLDNNAESMNHVLKMAIDWKPQSIPGLGDSLRDVIKGHYIDVERAFIVVRIIGCHLNFPNSKNHQQFGPTNLNSKENFGGAWLWKLRCHWQTLHLHLLMGASQSWRHQVAKCLVKLSAREMQKQELLVANDHARGKLIVIK